MTRSPRPHPTAICGQHAQRREPLALLAIVASIFLVIGAASRADAAWPAPGDVLVLTTSFDGVKFHGHVFAVDPVTLVKTRVVDFDTFVEPEIYLASSNLHITPDGIAAAPDGSIWAFYHATFTGVGGALLRINANGTHRLFTIASPNLHPSGMAFEADGQVIVVTNNNNLAGLFRVDPSTGDVKRFILNNSDTDPDCNPNTNVCLPIAFREGYGVAVDPANGHIIVGDVEGGAKGTPTGTFCQQLADCGAVYVVVPGSELVVTDANSPYFGQTVVSGTKTLLSDFGDPAYGPIGDDAGFKLALASDGTILVTDPAVQQTAGGKNGALFQVQTNGTHDIVTRWDDEAKGQPGGSGVGGPFPVAITGDGTVLIGACRSDFASNDFEVYAICAVDADGVRRLWSDFGGTISIDGVDRQLLGARALAIQALIQPPIAKATAPATVAAGAGCLASVTLDGSASTDPNGGALTYEWREGGNVIATGVNPTVSLGLGPHTITLKVSNPSGASDSIDVTVTVTTDVTLTYLGPGLLQAPGSVIQVRASTAAGVLVGAPVTVTINGVAYQGTTDGAGVASVVVGVVAGTPATVQVTTTGGACQSAMTTVTVPVNRWPSASGSASAPNVADQSCTASVTLDASASLDIDGDPLTYRWAEDGTTLSTLKTATVTLGVGTHQITLTVDDGRGGSSTNIITAVVLGRAVTLDYTGPAQLTVGVSTPVTARLRTAGGLPIAGATIGFSINGFGSTGTTDASGVATANVTPQTVGATTLLVSYGGEPCVQSAQTSAPVTVIARPATLVVIKSVINDNGGNASSSAFTMTVNGVDPIPASFPGSQAGTIVAINAGAYSVSETNLPGYDASFSADCTGTIALGETKTCTIVNNDRPTTLQLTKNVRNDNGGTALPTAWTLTANGTTFTSGVPQQIAPGDYVLAESGGPAGYTAGSWICFGVGATLVGSKVSIAPTSTVSCAITNDDQPARLTLTKIVVNNNGGSAKASDWQLAAGATPFVSGVEQSINAGTYTLSESGGPGGYVPSGWVCPGGQLAGNVLTLPPGASVACSITNDDQAATLTVIKHVINDQGGIRQAADFTMHVAGVSPSPASFAGSELGVVVTLATGAYNVTESGPDGYTSTFSAGCAGVIATGESRTCTITNDDRPATLRLTKQVINNSGGGAPPTAWTLTANGVPFATDVGQNVAPGNYTLAESGGPSGYTAGPWICSGAAAVGNVVTVGPAAAVSCTITNDDEPARLTLTKMVVNNNGGTAAPSDWQLTANGQIFSSGVSQMVNGGTYILAESGGPAGYAASSWTCAGGVLAGTSLTLTLGEQATCSITNDDQAGQLTVIKRVVNDDGGGAASSDFTITVTGSAATPASFAGSPAGTLVTLDAGPYAVGETGPAGYAATTSGDCAGVMGLGEVKTCTITNDDISAYTPPAAQDQTVTTREDTPVPIVLTATDAENNPLTYAIVAGPANGSLSGAALNITYTPNPGYYGPDSFTFRANDGKADSNVATVRITVTPVRADVAISILDAPDPVVVGQPLTYTIRVSNLGPASAPATSAIVTLPAGAVLSAAPATCIGAFALTCPQGTLAAGEERSFVVLVVPQSAGSISATATAASTASDPVPANNSATTGTTGDRSPTSIALISSLNPSVFGQPVTFTATVTGFGPTGTVTFMDGAVALGSAALAAGGTATLTTNALAAGTHAVTTIYSSDGNNLPGSSATLAQLVQPTPTTTTLGASPNPSTAGTLVTFTATVAGPAPTGIVSFYDGATLLGTGTLVGGTASVTINLGVGQHVITAVYGGDANHAPSTSPPLTEIVNNPNSKTTTVTTLVSSANPSAVGQPVTFTATVTGANPTGTVTVKDVNAILGTAPLVGGVATLTVPGFSQGAHQISASYGGDSTNLPSTSTKLKQQTR